MTSTRHDLDLGSSDVDRQDIPPRYHPFGTLSHADGPLDPKSLLGSSAPPPPSSIVSFDLNPFGTTSVEYCRCVFRQ
jgi:hypothetical protein